MLDDIADAALGEQQHLIGVRALAQFVGDAGQDRAAKDRQPLHERLEGHSLLRVAPGVFPRLGVVLGPGQLRIQPERPKQRLEEGDRHLDQLVEGAVPVSLEQLRFDGPHGLGRDHPALGGVSREPVRHLPKQIARPLRHIGAL